MWANEYIRMTAFCLRNGVFLCCLAVAAIQDMKNMRIPNGCHVAAVIAWIAAAGMIFDSFQCTLPYIAAAAICGGGLWLVTWLAESIRGKVLLGGGDIKLLAVAAFYLGPSGILPAMLIACAGGLICALIRRRGGKSGPFPFGPWIALGTALMLLYGTALLLFYTS